MLFSFANISDNGVDASSTLRWASVINLQGTYNYDLNTNIGLPVGIKIGNFVNIFFYGGY